MKIRTILIHSIVNKFKKIFIKCATNYSFFYKKNIILVIDATAKLPSGILNGHHFVMGDFDECLNINEDKSNSSIQGKYCTVLVTPSKAFSNDISGILDGISVSNENKNKQPREITCYIK